MTWVNSIIQFAGMQFCNKSSVNCILCLPPSSEVSSHHHLFFLYLPLSYPTPLSLSTEKQPALFSWFFLLNVLMHPSFQTQGTYAFPCKSSYLHPFWLGSSLCWCPCSESIASISLPFLLIWFSFLLYLVFSFAYFFHATLSFFPSWWKALLAKPSYPCLLARYQLTSHLKNLKTDF